MLFRSSVRDSHCLIRDSCRSFARFALIARCAILVAFYFAVRLSSLAKFVIPFARTFASRHSSLVRSLHDIRHSLVRTLASRLSSLNLRPLLLDFQFATLVTYLLPDNRRSIRESRRSHVRIATLVARLAGLARSLYDSCRSIRNSRRSICDLRCSIRLIARSFT